VAALPEFVVGKQIKIEATIKVGGVLTDGTVVVKVKDPNQNVASYTPNHPSTGVYNITIIPNIVGTWWVQFVSTGAVVTVDENAWVMKSSQFP
jgi:hypothetical protein